MKQRAVIFCAQDHCEQHMKVVRADTEYEFRAECPAGHKRLISWAHHEPPPDYEAEPEDKQQGLFG